MAKDVKCEVDTCHYWAQGNKCNAEEILVNYNFQTTGRSYVEFGMIEKKNTTDATCCETFRPKAK